MKNTVLAAVAASALIVAPAAFAKGPTDAGANANEEYACFGTARADYMSNNDDGGQIISERARSDASDPNYANLNVEENALFKMACEAANE